MKHFLIILLLIPLSGFHPLSAQSTLVSDADVSFQMGSQRRNWTHARWKVIEFNTPRDLSSFNAIELSVASPTPRRDAGVTFAVREADGSWYAHPWAADLSAGTNTGTAYFKDFSSPAYHNPPQGGFKDENNRLDTDAITAVAVGVVNPLGVGEVSFTVTHATAVAASPSVDYSQPLNIQVTGKLLDINGTTFLPAGVFGSFNLKSMRTDEGKVKRIDRYRLAMDKRIDFSRLGNNPAFGSESTPMVILAVGDRTQPSRMMTDSDWKEKYRNSGKSLGEAVAAQDKTAWVEFWNEPYLNWANDNRVNFDPDFFDKSRAVEGGPVHLKYSGEVMPFLRWTKEFETPGWNWTRAGRKEWRRGRTAQGQWSVPEHARPYKTPHHIWRQQVTRNNPPDTIADGETYEAEGKTYTAFTPWHIYDETQFTYWSGKGMLKPYIEPLVTYATAVKETAGDQVKIIAGWGNRPSEDHWAAFHMLYKPTIDAAIEVIDGYNEHDYGGDPRLMPANYEVVTGYGQVTHGKWLYAYNTETASNADPQTRSGEVQLSGNASKFTWVSRKIAALLDFSPDKNRAQAHFGVGGGFWSDEGEGVAMDLMRNLRGRLIHTIDSDPDLYVISSIDGTDPMAPRPDDLPDRQELVTLLLNDHSEKRKISVTLTPPSGTRFTKNPVLKRGKPNWFTGKVTIQEIPMALSDPEKIEFDFSLPPGEPMVITVPLEGSVHSEAPATVVETQYFGDVILKDVTPDAPARMSIPIEVKNITRARIRYVAERLGHGEAVAILNGTAFPLPAAVAPENHALIREISIDPADLQKENTLEFRIPDSSEAGFHLGIASLIVEREL